jgi:hypothetical protein
LKASVSFNREKGDARRTDASHFVETVETLVQRESISDVNLTVTGSVSCPLPKFHVGPEN